MNAGRKPARASTVVSGRMPSSRPNLTGSPFRCGTSTVTTSSASLSESQASWALACERAAQASWPSREMPSSALIASVPSPMCRSSKAHQRPSWIIVSSIGESPNLAPARAFGSTNGAFVIDSMPPATATSSSPARII